MMTIEIESNEVRVFQNNSGVLEQSPISISPYDLSSIFSELVEENKTYSIPYGCVKSYYLKNEASFLIESPSSKKEIKSSLYRDSEPFEIITPKMYFLCNGNVDLSTESFSMTDSHYFISPNEFENLVTDKCYVYHYGLFSNYNPSFSRGVCLGGTDQSFFSNCRIQHLSSYTRLFFASNFNGDLLTSPNVEIKDFFKKAIEEDVDFRNFLIEKYPSGDLPLLDEELYGDKVFAVFAYLEFFSKKYNAFPYEILSFYPKHGKRINDYTRES